MIEDGFGLHGGLPRHTVDTMTADVVVYAFDTMADWEYAHLTTVLMRTIRSGDDRFRLRVLSQDGEPVTTLGGLRLLADGSLADLDPAAVGLLVLPGGNTWREGHDAVLVLARSLLNAGTPVAGICGATRAMALAGLCEHHANVLDADDVDQDYPGAGHRIHQAVAVLDGALVTAIGEAPLEFAREVFRALELDSPEEIDAWYGSFKDVADARG